MSVTAHQLAIDTFVPMLRSLSKVLGEGAKHAKAKSFDAAVQRGLFLVWFSKGGARHLGAHN